MFIRSMVLVAGVLGAVGCVADEGAPIESTASISQNSGGGNYDCHNKTGGGGQSCDGHALIIIPVNVDIIDDVELSDIELELLEDALDNSLNVGNIGDILSDNELKVFDVLNDLNLGVDLSHINVCASLLGGLLCK